MGNGLKWNVVTSSGRGDGKIASHLPMGEGEVRLVTERGDRFSFEYILAWNI